MPETSQTRDTATSGAIRRHLADLCLIAALLLVLAVSLDRASSSPDRLTDGHRNAVGEQVGAPAPGATLAEGRDTTGIAPARTD